MRRLAERGRKKIVMVAPRQDQFYSIEMIAYARAEAERRGLGFDVLEGATSDDNSRIEYDTPPNAPARRRPGALASRSSRSPRTP